MPQLSSSSTLKTETNASADESRKDSNSKTAPYKRKLRTRSKNSDPEPAEDHEEFNTPETPEKKPAKKGVKRKSPAEKKPAAKSAKPRGSKKKETEKKAKNENAQKKLETMIKTEIDDDDDDEDMEEGEIPSSIAAETRTYYSCKLCHKDFSSAFILCLHLQIHKKVASTKLAEEESSTAVKEESQNGTVKIEKIESTEANVDAAVEDEDDEDEPGLIAPENCQPPGVINKNFVENLKRNLSLAMARNNL